MNKFTSKFTSKNETETEQFCQFLHKKLQNLPQAIVLLEGDLGVGKTFMTSKTIPLLLNNTSIEVTSPTFTIVNSYGNVNHYDLYRIKNEEELDVIGFYESLFDNINFIEWPQIADKLLNRASKFMPVFKVNITYANQAERQIILTN